MARQKTSPIEDVITIASKLPWWLGTTLALASYLALHSYASRPFLSSTVPGQLGAAAVHGIYTTMALFGQYVLPFAFGLGALISGVNQAKQKKLYSGLTKRPGVAALNDMSWSDFERLVSEYYRRKGFQVTREGGSGPDGGVDLVLRQKGEVHLVQCKQWKAYKVGVQAVREFYGVMASRGVAGGYFVTSGQYTDEAKRFVQGLNLELIDGRKLRGMIDVAQKRDLSRITDPTLTVSAVSEPPSCPQCGSGTIKRMARQGSKVGKEFWGCERYPKCKGTRPLEKVSTETSAERPEPVIAMPASPRKERKTCPNYGTELVVRRFMSGPRDGTEFLACLSCKKGWPVGAAQGSHQ